MSTYPGLLAWIGPRLAGFVIVSITADEAEILTLGTDSALRRQGVASALLTRMMENVMDLGATVIFLEVGVNNDAARALYEQHGFVSEGLRKGYYDTPDGPQDAVIMKRALSGDFNARRRSPGPWCALSVGSPGCKVPIMSRPSGHRRRSNLSSPQPKPRFARSAMTKLNEQLSKIELLCADRGMRMTVQRSIIARVLSAATDHPDVEEVYHRAHQVDNRISLSTVYRTVRLFENAGIIDRHDFGDSGRARYERVKSEHHDHLIDTETGKVIEFKNEEIEKLQERVARELGYELVGHRLELYGRPLRDR